MLTVPGMLERIRGFFRPGYASGFGDMSYAKSIKILNVTRGSGIAERYKTLMRLNHPDIGGSPYLASKINEAKTYLLESRRRI